MKHGDVAVHGASIGEMKVEREGVLFTCIHPKMAGIK